MNVLRLLAAVDIGQSFSNNFGGGYWNPAGAPRTLGEVITKLIPQIYFVALLLVLVYLTWGAYRYLISGGDPKAVDAAKKQLTWAVIGMIIVFLSYGLFQLLNTLVNNVYTI